MIQFYGKISPTCNEKANRKQISDRGTAWLCLSPICFAIGLVLFAIGSRFTLLGVISVYLMAFSLPSLATGIRCKIIAKRPTIACKVYDTTNIVFEDSWVTYEEIELNRTATFHVNDIRRAVDLGDCYLLFVANKYAQHIVCQKSLLVEGELDEFEELIADKL